MRSKIFLRFVVLSVTSAMLLGLITLFALRTFTEGENIEFRRNAALTMARVLETGPLKDAVKKYEDAHPDSRVFRGKVWVVSNAGEILNSNNHDPLPEPWGDLPKPEKIHDLELGYRTLGLTPSVSVTRLATSEQPTYLVLSSQRENRARRFNFLQILLFGSALAFSALISVVMTFFYLQTKSKQARDVLLRLEHGDLKARFQIKQFDEMGSLMLDFNRMAAEIERLVGKLEETEQARKMIFQELSHDLRTPLTSLRASIDTLALHWEEMPAAHREEIVSVCQTETSYFMELLENLLFIAQMDEPRYKKTTEAVDLPEILDSELRVRQAQQLSGSQAMHWELNLPNQKAKLTIPGDSHLIRRVVKNLLENAERFAKTTVSVSLSEQGSKVLLRIQDDGPGMSAQDVEQFGRPRSRRVMNLTNLSHISLGLGSVIVSKILALHQGSLAIRSSRAGTFPGGLGTMIEIQFPRI